MDYPPYVTRVHYSPSPEIVRHRQRRIHQLPRHKKIVATKKRAKTIHGRKKNGNCSEMCAVNRDRSFRENVDVFCGRTTIQGVCQMVTRKGFLSRILWFIVSAMGITMAVYQSWDVIQDYYGKSIIQKLSFKTKGAPFPAVTICKALLVKTNVGTSQDTSNSNTDEDADENTYFNNDGITPTDSLSFIRKCKFGTANCNLTNPDEVLPWINPRYGRCFTFNPGFRYVKQIDAGIGLYILMDITDNPESPESDYAILVVHQAGTPPILHKTKFYRINSRELVTVKMRARELVKLKGTLDCVKPTEQKQRRQLVFFHPSAPYIYTTQVCQKSCEIKRRKNRFGCYDPSAVINTTDMPTDKWSGAKLCDYKEISYDVDQDYRTPCLCVAPCRETILEETVTKTPTTCKDPNNPGEINNTNLIPNADGKLCAVIKVSYGNVPYEIIQEQRKYSDADFWGIIGGNVGLWVGICIISLLEVVEFLIHLFTTAITKLIVRVEEDNNNETMKQKGAAKKSPSPVGGKLVDDRWLVHVTSNPTP